MDLFDAIGGRRSVRDFKSEPLVGSALQARRRSRTGVENLMLAAYALGLGSCWIGFAQSWLDTDEGRAATGCPKIRA